MATGERKQDPVAEFQGLYCSGLFVPEDSAVSALALLFKRVFLPNNIELVRAFSKKYRIELNIPKHQIFNVAVSPAEGDDDPFPDLSDQQRETASKYLLLGALFLLRYQELMPEVFDTDLYTKGRIFKEELIKRGGSGEKNRYLLRSRPTLVADDTETIPKLIHDGYVPVVGRFHPLEGSPLLGDVSLAKQLAALLAMKSVEMLFPRTQPAHPQVILEARYRLSDQLPPFWSAMLKLSVELRGRIRDCKSAEEIAREGQELVDTLVRPALIDLRQKLIKEKRQWFHRILSPIQKGLRLLVGNPPLTQQQLLTNALVLGADVAMAAAENMRQIEALKGDAGLTFLLDLYIDLGQSTSGRRKKLTNRPMKADAKRRRASAAH